MTIGKAVLFFAQVISAATAARYTGGFTFHKSRLIGFGMLGRAELAFVVMDIAYIQNDILSTEAFYTLMLTAFFSERGGTRNDYAVEAALRSCTGPARTRVWLGLAAFRHQPLQVGFIHVGDARRQCGIDDLFQRVLEKGRGNAGELLAGILRELHR